MSNQPLISVIIPVYNREKYIRNCLEILINQSYKNIEIIVVDDGSSDSSLRIVKEYPQVKLIEHEVNKGQAAARNTGMKNSTGKYTHFMDDDDEINNTFYTNLLAAAEETNADMACCSYIYQKRMNKSQLFTKKKIYTSTKDKYLATYVGKNGFAWRYLFKSSFLKENNLIFEEGRLIEDLPFSFKAVFYANKIVTVPDAKYLYVFNPTSSLNTKNKKTKEKTIKDYKHARQLILNFAKENGNFKIPGVNTGKVTYFLKKVKLAFQLALKHRDLKHLKF